MPWADVLSKGDWVAYWYLTNSGNSCASALDRTRPTVLLLHPHLLDLCWLRRQLEDPRLADAYNIVAFDARAAGRTKHRPTGYYDAWVMVGDVAHLHATLRLPPVHVFAADAVTSFCALRLAALFPEMVLSLTLCHVRPPDVIATSLRSMLSLVPEPEWDSPGHARTSSGVNAWTQEMLGPNADPDELSEMVAFWAKTYPSARRSRLLELISFSDTALTPMSTVMSAVRQPTLLIQGEWGDEHGEEFARQFVKELNHVEGGARIHSVKGASVVSDAPNKPFLAFLASLPYASSPLGPPVPLFTRMARALARLADWMADSEIARRDPTSPLSFSMVPQTAAARRMDVLRGVSGCVIERLLLPHGPDGRPLELFSARLDLLVALKARGARAPASNGYGYTDADEDADGAYAPAPASEPGWLPAADLRSPERERARFGADFGRPRSGSTRHPPPPLAPRRRHPS